MDEMLHVFDGFEAASSDYGRFLGSFVEYMRCCTVVEIGVAFGTTTRYLCEAVAVSGKWNDRPGNRMVYGFDSWCGDGQTNPHNASLGSKAFAAEYLRKYKFGKFELHKMDTVVPEFQQKIEEIAKVNEGIDFCFIDGDHRYEGVKNDFEVIYPHLSKYGVIAFHDTFNHWGARKFVMDLRTTLYDGTFDLFALPWGNRKTKCGLTLLCKRDQVLGADGWDWCDDTSVLMLPTLLAAENEWYAKEKAKCSLKNSQ
jgi:hypothetical protein